LPTAVTVTHYITHTHRDSEEFNICNKATFKLFENAQQQESLTMNGNNERTYQ